jgi:predicted  nucleic acid-binding Zn-ribbon protein
VANLAKAVEQLKKCGCEELLGAAMEKLEAAKSAKLLGRPVSQQCRRMEQLLARKQKSLETTAKKIDGTKDHIAKLLAEIKDDEVHMAGLEIEIEALAKEISRAPKCEQKPADIGLVPGADQVPPLFKEGEAWKKAQANLDEAIKTMQDLVQEAKPEQPVRGGAPDTPHASQAAGALQAELAEEEDDADMEDWDEVSKALLDNVFSDDAVVGLSDELRHELKRKANEAVDGAIKAKKHLLKARKSRATLG